MAAKKTEEMTKEVRNEETTEEVKAEAKPEEKPDDWVNVYLMRDSDKYKGDVFVQVNGVGYSFNVDAGVYIAFANIRWSSNAKGSRHIGFAEKTTEAFADMNAHYSIVAPSTDGMTFQNLAVILKYENPAHVDIRVQQFSGGDLKIRTRLSLLKVKS